MEISIITEFDKFLALKEEWNRALKKSRSNTFFLTYEWLANWWEFYGFGHKLFIIIIRERGEIIAAAPFMIKIQKFGPLVLYRRLQFIAHDVSDYMDLIITGKEQECFELIFECVKNNQNCWNWAEFIYLPATSPFLSYWRNQKDSKFRYFNEIIDISVFIDLDDCKDFDFYLRSLNKRVRNDINRQENNIRKIGELTMHVYTKSADITAVLSSFFELHKKRWADRGMPSQFGDDRLRMRYASLAKLLEKDSLIELDCLCLNSQVIALHYGFSYDNRFYWYTPTFNPDFQKYSPGKLLLARVIKSSLGKGVKVFDLLRGGERYKFFWTDKKIDLYKFVIIKPSYRSKIGYFLSVEIKRLLKGMPLAKEVKNFAVDRLRRWGKSA